MRLKWSCALLLAAAFTLPAVGQVSVYIGSTPPPLRYERRGPPPGPDFVWAEGYWAPNGRHYRWVEGHWEHPPYEGAYWSHPHYDHYQEGWQFHEGHWDREDYDNGHWRGRDRGDYRRDERRDDHRDDHHEEHHDDRPQDDRP